MYQQSMIYSEYKANNEHVTPYKVFEGVQQVRRLIDLMPQNDYGSPSNDCILSGSPKMSKGSGELEGIYQMNDGRVAEIYVHFGHHMKAYVWESYEVYSQYNAVADEYHYFNA